MYKCSTDCVLSARQSNVSTQGFTKPAAHARSSKQGCISFQDSDGRSVWKEIHIDTIGRNSRSLSFETVHILNPSMSATSLEHTSYLNPLSANNSPHRMEGLSTWNSPRQLWALALEKCSGLLGALRWTLQAPLSIPQLRTHQGNAITMYPAWDVEVLLCPQWWRFLILLKISTLLVHNLDRWSRVLS